jgi:urease beta subunit
VSKAGEIITAPGDIELNAGRESVTLNVKNTGDRAVQVGSHYHFFEANKALDFDRNKTLGFRLDIPAGTAVRFEPGTDADVTLVALAGHRRVFGFASLVSGSLDSRKVQRQALAAAKDQGFKGAKG